MDYNDTSTDYSRTSSNFSDTTILVVEITTSASTVGLGSTEPGEPIDDNSLSNGVKIGILVGSIALFSLLAFFLLCLMKRETFVLKRKESVIRAMRELRKKEMVTAELPGGNPVAGKFTEFEPETHVVHMPTTSKDIHSGVFRIEKEHSEGSFSQSAYRGSIRGSIQMKNKKHSSNHQNGVDNRQEDFIEVPIEATFESGLRNEPPIITSTNVDESLVSVDFLQKVILAGQRSIAEDYKLGVNNVYVIMDNSKEREVR